MIAVVLIGGIFLGFFFCQLIIAVQEENKADKGLSVEKSIKIVENFIFSEAYISIQEEAAIKKLLEYAKEKLEEEDDGK